MNADDSARRRDLLANDRTLLAYIRTALAFAGLGFAVAKFGLSPKTHVSGYLGTFMVLVGLLVVIIGFVQHHAVLRQVGPPPEAVASASPCGGDRLRPGLRAAGRVSRGQRHLRGLGPGSAARRDSRRNRGSTRLRT